jgi:pimeloyl-ACP methyl ester carboxylesterase
MAYSGALRGLHYAANFNPDTPRPAAIVCLHGVTSSWRIFAGMLNASSTPMIAFDLPGCGESPRLEKYTTETIGQAVCDAIRELKVETIYAVGHSLGAHLLAYVDFPFAGLVLLGAPPLSSPADLELGYPPGEDRPPLLSLFQEERLDAGAVSSLLRTLGAGESVAEDLAEAVAASDSAFRLGCVATLTARDQVQRLREMPPRTVALFQAELDPVVSAAYVRSVAENLRQLYIFYPRGQHLLPLASARDLCYFMTNQMGWK